MDHLDHEEDDMAADAAIQENNNLPVEDSLEEMSEDMMDGTDSEKPLLKFRSDIFKDGVLDGTFTTGDVMEGLNTSTNLCRSNIELAIEMATSSDSDSGFLECSAKTQNGLYELFDFVIKLMLAPPPESKSATISLKSFKMSSYNKCSIL